MKKSIQKSTQLHRFLEKYSMLIDDPAEYRDFRLDFLCMLSSVLMDSTMRQELEDLITEEDDK